MPDRLPPAAPLPEDAIALHIGVHKTGTTALQAALAEARSELAARNVLYPGRRTAHHGAASALVGRATGWAGRGAVQPYPGVFERVARQARRHRGRVLISSEGFCEADDAQAARAVQLLGPRTHVVVALRSLGGLLYSSWQQYLKAGRTMPYDRWLSTVLDPDRAGSVTPSFWRRNEHGVVVRRWVRILGPERVTVLVLEDVPAEALFVSVAELLGIPPELLTSRMGIASNRSMTAAEAELVRRLNRRLKDRLDWPDYERLVREGVVREMVAARTPGPEEPRPATPDWALDAAWERSQCDVDLIRESGAVVLGDLDLLARRVPTRPPVPPSGVDLLPTDAVVDVLAAAVLARAGGPRPRDHWALARRMRNRAAASLPRP